MSVAGCQLRPGIADPDHWASIKQMVGQALVLHPGTIEDTHFIHFPEPLLAAEASLCRGSHRGIRVSGFEFRVEGSEFRIRSINHSLVGHTSASASDPNAELPVHPANRGSGRP